MSVEGHIKALQSKKQELETKLERAMSQPSTDATEISQIKREKLKIKDQIIQLKGS